MEYGMRVAEWNEMEYGMRVAEWNMEYGIWNARMDASRNANDIKRTH